MNPAIVRRLVALELSDINVPGNPRIEGDSEQDVTLHCRVMSENGALRVEVWERGESAGARLVSLQGTQALVARRVALAAAELARRLAHGRQLETRRLELDAREAERVAAIEQERRRRERLALSTRGRAVGFLQGAYLAGPRVGAQLNGDHPLRTELGLTWMAGQITRLSGVPAWSTWELDVTPAWVLPLSSTADFVVGLPVTAGIVHTHDNTAVDRIVGQRSTWLGRGGLEARFQPRLSSRVRLDFGVAGGWMLRGIPLERRPTEGLPLESTRLAGPWLELAAGVLLD